MPSIDPAAFDTHGRIKCGTVTTPAFDASLADYTGLLRFTVIEQGLVPADLAASWGTPASAGQRMALLGTTTGAPGFVRLIEGPAVPDYVPLRSYGWASFEFTVADVWTLHDSLKDSVFDIIGPPKLVEGFDNFIPMQVIGRAGEVLYLNKVQRSMSDLELPAAHAWVDHIFIVPLAARDDAATLDFYTQALRFERGGAYTITYSVINQAFGFDDSVKTRMTMTRVGTLPNIEVDQYPPQTIERPTAPGALPPGCALVSFIVDGLDGLDVQFLTPPARRDGPLYAGRRVATCVGPSGELVELIEARP
jgi:hypothetical protein